MSRVTGKMVDVRPYIGEARKKKLYIEVAGEKVIDEVVRRLEKKKQSYLSKYNISYCNPSNPSSPFSIQTRTVEQLYAL